MVRIKHSVATHKRKKRLLKKARGQFGDRSKRYQQARRSLKRGMVYTYRDRKVKKREIKNVWIIRINAACRENGISYSRFIKALNDAKIEINRKILADLAVNAPETFDNLVKMAKDSKPAPAKKVAKAAAKS